MNVIDRFEGDIAVVEIDGRNYDFPKSIFPHDIREGDIFKIQIAIDKEETQAIRKRMEEDLEKIRKMSQENEKRLKNK